MSKSNSYVIEGRVIQIDPVKVISDKFSKQTFVLVTEPGRYEQEIQIEASGAAIELLAPIRVDDDVKVECNLRGRRWNGPNGTKWFLELRAWKIERVGKPAGEVADRPTVSETTGDNSDLPF